MIKARHTYLGKAVAGFYSGYKLDRAFRHVCFNGEIKDRGLPVLLLANHFTWWDGFIQYRLNQHTFKRKLHVMMLEEELRKFMILNHCGVFSVRKKSRDIIESLRYSIDLLSDKNNMVLIFPQGEIQSLYTHAFSFAGGVNYILEHLQQEIQVIFNINLVDYFSEKYPSLTIYLQDFNYHEHNNLTMQQSFNHFAGWCKSQQKER